MTPERAKELAEANGCTFVQIPSLVRGYGYRVDRQGVVNSIHISDWALEDLTDETFIAHCLPDKRN